MKTSVFSSISRLFISVLHFDFADICFCVTINCFSPEIFGRILEIS